MRHGCDAGFSLVEVMIAALLLATSLTALAELFAVAVRNNAVAAHSTESAVFAAQKVEELRGDAALLSPSGINTLQTSTDGYVDVPDGTAYIRRWSEEPVPASPVTVVQVLVTRRRDRGAADEGSVARAPEEARVITIVGRAR
jgi:prepilin-type N-terminal cleavage/methylation domain-containing protein